MVNGNPSKYFLQESNARSPTLRPWSSTELFRLSQSYQDLHDQQRIYPFSQHLLHQQRQPQEHVAHRQRSQQAMLMPEGRYGYYPTARPHCPSIHQHYNHRATYMTPTSKPPSSFRHPTTRSSHVHETFMNK